MVEKLPAIMQQAGQAVQGMLPEAAAAAEADSERCHRAAARGGLREL